MDLIAVREFGKGTDWGFSLYFLATLTDEQRASLPDPSSEEAMEVPRNMFQPVLELTHNHGTESNPDFKCVEFNCVVFVCVIMGWLCTGLHACLPQCTSCKNVF
jgi:hypothetical protein